MPATGIAPETGATVSSPAGEVSEDADVGRPTPAPQVSSNGSTLQTATSSATPHAAAATAAPQAPAIDVAAQTSTTDATSQDSAREINAQVIQDAMVGPHVDPSDLHANKSSPRVDDLQPACQPTSGESWPLTLSRLRPTSVVVAHLLLQRR